MFEGEFEQVEHEIMNDIFEIAKEGEQRDNLKQKWEDFKEVIEDKAKEKLEEPNVCLDGL